MKFATPIEAFNARPDAKTVNCYTNGQWSAAPFAIEGRAGYAFSMVTVHFNKASEEEIAKWNQMCIEHALRLLPLLKDNNDER